MISCPQSRPNSEPSIFFVFISLVCILGLTGCDFGPHSQSLLPRHAAPDAIATALNKPFSFMDAALDPALFRTLLAPLPRWNTLAAGQRFSQGYITTDFAGEDDGIRDILLQADGKLLVVGWTFNGNVNDFAMARYETDGTLDQSFGTGGMVVTSFPPGDCIIHAVVLDSQNRILVVGRVWSNVTHWDFLVSRYNADGSLDTGFGTNGHTQVDFGGSEFARATVLDSLGRIIVVGYSNEGTLGVFAFAVARLLADGTLDNTFSGDGRQTANFPGNTFCTAYAALVDGSNQIYAAGRTRTPGGVNDFALARFTEAGALDNTFSGDGLHTQNFTTDDIAWTMTFDELGRIVLAGRSWSGSQYDMRFARYTTAGVNDGSVAVPVDQGGVARAIELDEANRFLISGHAYDGTHWNFATMRILNTGLLDATYGTGGITLTAIGADDDDALALVYNSGIIHAAGKSHNGSDLDFAIARYNIDGDLALSGELDPYLNNTGVVTASVGSGNSVPYAVAVQDDYRIITAGYSHNGSNNVFTTLRYLVDGTPDASFNGTGNVTTDVSGFHSVVNSLVLQSDGKIVAVGNAYSGSENDFALARYHTDGALDTGFAGTGFFTTRIGDGDDQANAAVQDSNGRIVVVGSSVTGTAKNLAVLRYLSDGTLDASFGGSGVILESFGNVPQWHPADQQINHGDNTATELSVNQPTNLSAGDLIIVLASVRTTTRPVPPPAGFTLIHEENGGANNTGYLIAFYKIATDSEPATYTMASNPGSEWFAISGRVTGVDPDNPIGDISGANSGATSVTSLALPGITTTIDNALLFAAWQNRNATTVAAAPPSMTQHWAHNTPRPMAIGASQLIGSPVATGTRTASWTGGERAAGLMFEIRPGGVPTAASDDTGYGVVIDSDNRIIVGGQSSSPILTTRFGLMRFLSDGSLDPSFGTEGRLTTNISGTWGAQLFGLALDGDGKIVAAGRTLGLQQNFAIARYNIDGSLDAGFNTNGILVSTISANASVAYGMRVADNNKIVVVGTTGAPNEFVVARYTTDGSLDASFATAGIYRAPIGSNDSIAHAVAFDPAGRIIVTGTSFDTNWDFATLRLFP